MSVEPDILEVEYAREHNLRLTLLMLLLSRGKRAGVSEDVSGGVE